MFDVIEDNLTKGKQPGCRRNFGKYKKGVILSGCKVKPFRARLKIDGKYVQLGHFKTEDAAHAAYVKAVEEFSKECQTALRAIAEAEGINQ